MTREDGGRAACPATGAPPGGIGERRGGIVDYAREGETAWLNRSVTAEELAGHMLDLIAHPERVDALSARVVAARPSVIRPFAGHVDELEAIYRDVAAQRRSSLAPAAA